MPHKTSQVEVDLNYKLRFAMFADIEKLSSVFSSLSFNLATENIHSTIQKKLKLVCKTE